MIAIKNILTDILFQFRLSGGLFQRLICVISYYAVYGAHRLRGLSQESSRLRALFALSKLGSTRRTVDVVLPDGTSMTLDLMGASFAPREFIEERMYDKMPQFIPKPGQTVVDVGAHQGFFSVSAAKRIGATGKLLALEPCSTNLDLLRKNLDKNHLTNATAMPCAAANFDGETDLFLTPLVSGGSSLFFRSEPEVIPRRDCVRVQVKRLDRILREAGVGPVDLIKIDAEGACLSILDGAPETLKSRPRLVMEVEGGEAEVRKVEQKLSSLGYRWSAHDSILYAEAQA